jgi:hypothetical protein
VNIPEPNPNEHLNNNGTNKMALNNGILLTPFREKRQKYNMELPNTDRNYDEYDIFCLLGKLYYYFYRVNRSSTQYTSQNGLDLSMERYTFIISSEPLCRGSDGNIFPVPCPIHKSEGCQCSCNSESMCVKLGAQDIIAITVKIMDGNKEIKLSEKDNVKLQKFIDGSTTDVERRRCLLLYDKAYTDYPLDWLKCIIPFIVIDEKYKPYYNNNLLSVNLEADADYTNLFSSILKQVEQQIKIMDDQGIIPLCPVIDKVFIRKWRLRHVVELERTIKHQLTYTANLKLYSPSWSDDRICKHKGQFMRNIRHGKTEIVLNMNDLVLRHCYSISLFQLGLEYYFYKDNVHIVIDNIHSGIRCADLLDLIQQKVKNKGKILGLRKYKPTIFRKHLTHDGSLSSPVASSGNSKVLSLREQKEQKETQEVREEQEDKTIEVKAPRLSLYSTLEDGQLLSVLGSLNEEIIPNQ